MSGPKGFTASDSTKIHIKGKVVENGALMSCIKCGGTKNWVFKNNKAIHKPCGTQQ